jgi:TPR repeat protein
MWMGSFEGDVAVKELRERMARAPDLPPEPPMRYHRRSFGMVGRLAILVTIAATAVYGSVWTSTPRDQPVDSGFTPGAYGKPGAEPALNNTAINAASSNNSGFGLAVFQSPPVQATADMVQPRVQAPPDERPQGPATVPWLAPDVARDLANASNETDTDDVIVAATANKASLSRSPPSAAAIQTTPAISASPRISDEERATLLASGRTFLIIGDVTAARLAFRRAAERGDAQASLALGGTFDPLVLKSLGVVGVAADLAQARGWYQKAAELGSRDARQRLNQLAQSVR